MYAPLTSKTPASCERITDLGSENHLARAPTICHWLVKTEEVVWFEVAETALSDCALKLSEEIQDFLSRQINMNMFPTIPLLISIFRSKSFPILGIPKHPKRGLAWCHSINGAFGRQDVPKLHQGSQGICQVKQRPGAENHVEAPSSGSGEPGP